MTYDPRLPLTDAQAVVLAAARQDAEVRKDFLEKAIAEASAAVVKLPAKNEHGDSVIHACNMQMHNIVDNYTRELNTLKFMWHLR